MIKKIFNLFGQILILSLLTMPIGVYAQFSTQQGGTGTTTPSGILSGDGTLHLKTVGIGLGCAFVTGILSCSGTVSTSSQETANQIPWWTSTDATPATLSGGSALFKWLNPGFLAIASSTIGAGARTTGLTIFGGATTTATSTLAGAILTTGNLGIGTNNPTAQLQLGAQGFSEQTISGVAGIKFQTQTANQRSLFTIQPTGSNTGSDLWLYNNSSNTNNDIFGIGYNQSFTQWSFFTSKAGTGTAAPIAMQAFAGADAGNVALTQVVLALNGGVGVGLVSPGTMLEIATSSTGNAFHGGQLTLNDLAGASNKKNWVFGSEGGNLYIGSSTDAFATSSPAALTILNSGNIGIATSSPFFILSVNGNFGIATSTSGCAQFSAIGELYSTGTACGSGSGGVTSVTGTYPISSSGGATPNISLLGFATTTLSVGSPLTITGTLGALVGGTNSTINCQTVSGSQAGCLSATDWTTFNGKQDAGNYITALTGDGTASGPGSASFTLATVNSNIGTFNNVMVNGKGLVTAASNVSYSTAGYPFPGFNNSTSTLTLFNGNASTTQLSAATGFFNFLQATSSTATSTFAGGVEIGTTTQATGGTNSALLTISNAAQAVGGLIINTWTNVTNAFSINNALGQNVFNVDTTATSPFLGIGTTTPWGTLSVIGNGTNPLFAVASSSNTALPNFEIDPTGHVVTSGQKPTISSCGSTNSISGNDSQGSIMFTGTLVTACTMTFVTPVPAGQTLGCTSSDNSLTGFSDISSTSTTAVTFGISTGLAAGTIYYSCNRWQ